MYLLSEKARWENIWLKVMAYTQRSEVRAPWPGAKYFPIRPDLTKSMSIFSYDQFGAKFSWSFNKRGQTLLQYGSTAFSGPALANAYCIRPGIVRHDLDPNIFPSSPPT